MITSITLKVFERMHDRKLAGIVADIGGDLVTERTVRNWLGQHTSPDVDLLKAIRSNSQQKLLEELRGKEWPVQEAQAFVHGLEACPGFVSTTLYGLQNRSDMYPALLRLAGQVDYLEQQLAEARADGDVRGWAQALLNADWIRNEQLENPDTGATAEDARRQLRDAQSWDDLNVVAAVFLVNTYFQLLATLDLEFCAAFLGEWEATPIFAALLPCHNPRVDLAGKTSIRTSRNLYHYPTRRLLDLVACMRVMRESPVKKWPSRVPAASKMVEWLQLVGSAEIASNLGKWRGGRPLTAERFVDLWDACFQFIKEADRPSVPMPMLYAATVFTELFVQGSLAKHNLSFISPDPAYYRHWWEIQRLALERQPEPLRFGTKPWMPALAI